MSRINIEFMTKVRDRIKQVGPEHCAMGSYLDRSDETGDLVSVSDKGRVNCGTTACIAGWTLAVKNGTFSEDDMDSEDRFIKEAQDALGLPYSDLFYMAFWPSKYKKEAMWSPESDGVAMVRILDALISGELKPNWRA